MVTLATQLREREGREMTKVIRGTLGTIARGQCLHVRECPNRTQSSDTGRFRLISALYLKCYAGKVFFSLFTSLTPVTQHICTKLI
jgi:hypothetical protein